MWVNGLLVVNICGGTFELCNMDCINCPKCNTTATNKTGVDDA